MTTRQRLQILAAIVALGGLGRGSAAAQSYGPGDQIYSVEASSFHGGDPFAVTLGDGYVYDSNGGAPMYLYAPLILPDGAVITQICLYANNTDPADVVDLGLQAVKLVPAGQAPGVVDIPGTLVSANFHFGYGVVCTDPISYVFHDTADVDGDGVSELVAHRLWAYVPLGSGGGLFGLGGARITWHREVSPAPATATFGDVPTSHPFFQYVEALAASGVTGGCGGGNYCPNSPVTRGQMAVFLSKALGLHWPL
jgi:S-layer homology domain